MFVAKGVGRLNLHQELREVFGPRRHHNVESTSLHIISAFDGVQLLVLPQSQISVVERRRLLVAS